MIPGLNLTVAARLDEVATLLERQGANPFRVEAYRGGAQALRGLAEPVDDVLGRGGIDALIALPGVGERLARAIRTLVETGRLPMLERLRGESDAVALLATVPGIGRGLAGRLHHDLGIGSLEDLEAAAYDGRLERMPLMGAKRLAAVRQSLATRLSRVRGGGGGGGGGGGRHDVPIEQPSVEELLGVDHDYRRRVAAHELPLIAPRRFNPAREAWLPVWHTERGERHYTALFSNTARAHELGRTRDWVVLYVDGARGERQYTVVTARRGLLRGRRVVRGREGECLAYYGRRGASGSPAPSRPPREPSLAGR
jgi:putative hydrolase